MRVHILGSLNLDVILEVDRLPRPGETLLALNVVTGPGGKGLNQALAAARYGGQIHLHGAVGADEAGAALLQTLRREGVDVGAVAQGTKTVTGRAYVMVSRNGENMIVVHSAANTTAAFAATESSDPAIYLTQLETPFEAAKAMFEAAKPGDLCIINAAPAAEEGRGLIPLADVVVVNETELSFFARVPEFAPDQTESHARRLISREGQTVIVTLGAEGAMIVDQQTSRRISARATKVVDTTGAGDCFVGVLAAAMASGASLEKAASLASVAASMSVETLGANSAPTRRALDLEASSLKS